MHAYFQAVNRKQSADDALLQPSAEHDGVIRGVHTVRTRPRQSATLSAQLGDWVDCTRRSVASQSQTQNWSTVVNAGDGPIALAGRGTPPPSPLRRGVAVCHRPNITVQQFCLYIDCSYIVCWQVI